ncbi:hypothetical protein MIND_01331700 [Mycena indigotica]|uniref:Uncharacterized protein n=1 Tax=Mycena indigotica TaxID=2126181 RepID=A0A8H6S0Q1_9AGAR|nr:uncharacterized protein MIND_01331700 [Mycena indigotica]KAF7290183.1 hypothetical protein MIND_01331700 [Mycena indigotica]
MPGDSTAQYALPAIVPLTPITPLVPRRSTSSSTSHSTASSSAGSRSASGSGSSGTATPLTTAQPTRTTTACPTPAAPPPVQLPSEPVPLLPNAPAVYIDDSHDVKSLPLPPPVLQPLRKQDFLVSLGVNPPKRRSRREEEPQRAWLGFSVLIPGVMNALLSVGMTTTFALYILGLGGTETLRDSDSLRLWGLFGSTAITNITWLVSFPILLSLCAYSVAASWLSEQHGRHSLRPALLTPLQFAILFRVFSSPGPASVSQATIYLARSRKRVQAPRFFGSGVVLAGLVLVSSYLISLANMWLQATARVVLLPGRRLHAYYPLAPTLTFITLLSLHSFLALGLTVHVACLRTRRIVFADRKHELSEAVESRPCVNTAPSANPPPGLPTAARDGPTALTLAHAQLTSPFAPIAALLGSPARLAGSGSSRAEGLIRALWIEDANTARVEVGIWRRNRHVHDLPRKSGSVSSKRSDGKRRWGDVEADADADGVFGVYKKVVPWRGEIY